MVMAGEDIRTFLRRMPRTVRVGVLPGGMSEFISIVAARNYVVTQTPAAGAEWVVQVWPGTYVEQITGAPFVRVVAMGSREQCIISQADADVVIGANDFSVEGFTLQVTAPSAPRTLVNCGATSPTIRKCRFVGSAAQPITAVSHTTGSPTVEDCETGANIAVLFYTNGAGTFTARRITSTATGAILTSAACGAAIGNVTDSDFGAGTITTIAGGTPSVFLTRVNGSGAITHACASSLLIANCNLTGGMTLSGNAFPLLVAANSSLGWIVHNGTGAANFEMCALGNIINNSTGTIAALRCSAGIIQQAAAAGLINLEDITTLQDISTGAGGTIRLYGKCYFGSISANAGVITWQVEERKRRVVASTANMRVADAIAAAPAGTRSTISIGPGVFVESNLVAKNLVDLIGDDPENSQIVANDPANPIITVPNGVTCTIQGLRVENTNGATPAVVRVTGGTLTLRKSYLKNTVNAIGSAAIYCLTAASRVDIYDGTIESPRAVELLGAGAILHTLNIRRSNSFGATPTNYGVVAYGGAAHIVNLYHSDFGPASVLLLSQTVQGLIEVCTRAHIDARDAGTVVQVNHCDWGQIYLDGAAVTAKSSSFANINMNNSAASSLTLDEACEISGAIINIHASATFIVPRKRLGAGLGAPGLLADATQMDSIIGAGAPINQAPATRTTTDWARTVKVVHAGVATAFPYNITLTGTAMLKGALVAVTEVITVTGAGTFRGVVPWHNISNWTSSGNIIAADTVKLQFDSRLGLEHRLRDATHLLACRKSPGGAAPLYRTPGGFTLDLTRFTIEETGVPVIAGDNYEYWVVKG